MCLEILEQPIEYLSIPNFEHFFISDLKAECLLLPVYKHRDAMAQKLLVQFMIPSQELYLSSGVHHRNNGQRVEPVATTAIGQLTLGPLDLPMKPLIHA